MTTKPSGYISSTLTLYAYSRDDPAKRLPVFCSPHQKMNGNCRCLVSRFKTLWSILFVLRHQKTMSFNTHPVEAKLLRFERQCRPDRGLGTQWQIVGLGITISKEQVSARPASVLQTRNFPRDDPSEATFGRYDLLLSSLEMFPDRQNAHAQQGRSDYWSDW